MKRKHSDPWIVVIFFAVFLIMLAFNILSPLVSDDYAFSFGVDGQRVAMLPPQPMIIKRNY